MLRQVKRATGATVGAIAAVVATIAVGCDTGTAWAVDVVNTDKVPREIVINDSDGQSKMLTLSPRGKLSDVCDSCVVLSGNTSAEAAGKTTVRIEGGNVVTGSK
ncbi:MAG: hypothetical protein EPO08_03405 [Rhodospirillaceae bacterium]|nr:MAG: hypothetical protein EPO08_03405 [Rhodospirillaceae bacterium]